VAGRVFVLLGCSLFFPAAARWNAPFGYRFTLSEPAPFPGAIVVEILISGKSGVPVPPKTDTASYAIQSRFCGQTHPLDIGGLT